MKPVFRILCICSLLWMSVSISWAQDLQRFSERHLSGTARYVGMAGAMTAIGGDPTAALDNPAGLGVYRQSELSVTIDETIDKTVYQSIRGDIASNNQMRFMAPNVAIVWATGKENKLRGMIHNNFMFTYNRMATFNRLVYASAAGTGGLLPTICLKTQYLPEQQLASKPWDDPQVGWLSILGYETYLINPIDNDQWEAAVSMNSYELQVEESGSSDQYTVSWATNISHQWYIGIGMNIPTWNYTKRSILEERNDANSSAKLQSLYHVTGVGIGASLGIIYRPIQYLRLGFSAQTPMKMLMSAQTEGGMYSQLNGMSYELHTPASGVMSYEMVSPWRVSASVAGQWSNLGMLAVQYDFTQAMADKQSGTRPMNDVHSLRVGAEMQIYPSLYLNAGYVYESSFLEEDPVVELAYDAVRTDLDYRFVQHRQFASLGLGYRGAFLVANLAYQYRWEMMHQYASELQQPALTVAGRTHRIVFTLGWRI